MKGNQLWLWLIFLFVVAYAYLPKPVHFIAFKSAEWLDWRVAIGLGAVFSVLAVAWYFSRPVQTLPVNFANRWLGAPVLLVGAACSAGFLSAATIVPFAMAMVRGSNAPMVIEVSAHYHISGRRRGFDCQTFVLLANQLAWGPQRICLGSEADKRVLEELEPEAFVELRGWGDYTAMFYWSAKPVIAAESDL
jgi:hypothetical protein